MKNPLIIAAIFLFGGLAYGALEIAFRGRTHLSMLFAGGLCVLSLYVISAKSSVPVWKKWLVAGMVITTVEFVTGGVVNILLGLKVWDYSMLKMNLLGQICLHFSIIWTLLSIPVIWLLGIVDKRFLCDYQRKVGSEYDGNDGY